MGFAHDRLVHLVIRSPVDLTNRKASLRLDALEERALLSADPLEPFTPVVPLTPDVVAPADPVAPSAPAPDDAAVPLPEPTPTDAPTTSGAESEPAAEAEDEYVWVPVWFYALDFGIWVDDEVTAESPAPTDGVEQDGSEQPTAPPADDEEGETFPIAAATDGPATNPPATPPAAPPAASGNQAYDWFVRRMGEAAPQPTPNQSTQQPVDWLARISDPNDPLGRSFNGPELPSLGGDKPVRPRFVPVVTTRDPFALDDNLRTLNSLIVSASGQTFDWDRIDYWAKRDAERLRPQLDMATRVGVVAADVMSIGTEIAVGMTTLEFGGFVLVAHGFDRAVARIESLRTGTPQMSLTADYLFHRTIGMSKADATAADDLAGDLLPLGVTGIRGMYRWVKAPGAPVSVPGATGTAGNADVVAPIAGVPKPRSTGDFTLLEGDLLRASRTYELRKIIANESIPQEIRTEALRELARLKHNPTAPVPQASVVVDANSLMAAIEAQGTPIAKQLAADIRSGRVKIIFGENLGANGLYNGKMTFELETMNGRTPLQVVRTAAHEYRHGLDDLAGPLFPGGKPNTQWSEFRAFQHGRDVYNWNDPAVQRVLGKRPTDAELWERVRNLYPHLPVGDPLP